jgi:hypothetical protein
MELDGLIETASGIVGIEIKARENIYEKDLRVMKTLASNLGNSWKGGLVVYLGREIQNFDQNIWSIPSRRLFQI